LQHTIFATFAPYTAIALILKFQSESGKPRNARNPRNSHNSPEVY
jgi:hypothetical protein